MPEPNHRFEPHPKNAAACDETTPGEGEKLLCRCPYCGHSFYPDQKRTQKELTDLRCPRCMAPVTIERVPEKPRTVSRSRGVALIGIVVLLVVMTLRLVLPGKPGPRPEPSAQPTASIEEVMSSIMKGPYFFSQDGTATYMEYTGEEEHVKILGEVDGHRVTEIFHFAFQNCKSIKSVEIGDGVKVIHSHAFLGCENLEEIIIPDSVVSIEFNAFKGCKSLKAVTIPDGVTKIENWTFQDCESLEKLSLGKGLVAVGDSAFCGCKSLTAADFSEGVTTIGKDAFRECRSLRSVRLPDTVREIGNNAFYSCRSLESVSIPAALTDIGESCFELCVGMTELTLPEGLRSIGAGAFKDCRSLPAEMQICTARKCRKRFMSGITAHIRA